MWSKRDCVLDANVGSPGGGGPGEKEVVGTLHMGNVAPQGASVTAVDIADTESFG
jgi:hypothetical protein